MGMCGLSIRAKAGGTWKVTKPHVKTSGTWKKVKRAYSKVGTSWNKTYDYEWVYTFANGVHTDVDVDTLAGIDKFHNVRIVIPSGATLVASSTGTYALQTGSGYTGILTIQNSGKILGRGGNGGNGGFGYSYNEIANATNGTAGGTSVLIQSAVTIINTGTIAGGGGGGGGGEGYVHVGTAYGGGGGGGGGSPYGSAGLGGSTTHSGGNGAAGVLYGWGGGGGGGFDGTVRGGTGGAGGSGGVSGQLGGEITGDHSHVIESTRGSGGLYGATYYNPSLFTITQI
jgi:hypothetical protein